MNFFKPNICKNTYTHASMLYKLMSYNIAGYFEEPVAEQEQKHNKDVVDIVLHFDPDITILNETTKKLFTDNEGISEAYGMVDPFFGNIETRSMILFKKKLFELQAEINYCLTSTPEIYSKVDKSYHYRFVTVAKLKDKTSGISFYVLATHLENNSGNREIFEKRNGARILQAKYLLDIINERLDSEIPLIIAGDLNSTTDEKAVVREGGITQLLENDLLLNAADVADVTDRSYTHMGNISLDHILLKSNSISPLVYSVKTALPIPDNPSDHYPIMLTFRIENIERSYSS